jgi:hypothetical protein
MDVETQLQVASIPSPKNALNELISSFISQSHTPEQAKISAIKALLANIEEVDLTRVCESLGWKGGEDACPKQKHFKVVIIHTLIDIARCYNWYLIHDAGFFYKCLAESKLVLGAKTSADFIDCVFKFIG